MRLIGGWSQVVGDELSLTWQIALGLAGGASALLVNGVLHEVLSGLSDTATWRHLSATHGKF